MGSRDRKQGTGDKGQGTGNRGQETGDRGQETGDRRQGTGDRGRGRGHGKGAECESVSFTQHSALRIPHSWYESAPAGLGCLNGCVGGTSGGKWNDAVEVSTRQVRGEPARRALPPPGPRRRAGAHRRQSPRDCTRIRGAEVPAGGPHRVSATLRGAGRGARRHRSRRGPPRLRRALGPCSALRVPPAVGPRPDTSGPSAGSG